MPHTDPIAKRAYFKAYRERKAAELSEKNHIWREANAETIAAKKKEEYQADKETYINRSRKRWAERKDEINAFRRTEEYKVGKRETRKEWWNGLSLWERRFYSGLAQAYGRHHGKVGDLNGVKEWYHSIFASKMAQCEYCNAVIKLEDVQIDHRQPYRLGGTHCKENLAVACKECNQRKGSTPYSIWMAVIKEKGPLWQ